MQMDRSITTDAVIFFDDGIVVKEMLYPEFEAILDHVVGIQEFSDRQMSAVFVQINAQLQVIAAVFFVIDFEIEGYADKSWNIPLKHLANHAGRGPDLGAGSIKLSCRSQCSVSWHQHSLWDPDMAAGNKTFEQIVSVIKRNRLGITKQLPVESSESGQRVSSLSTDKSFKQLQKELKIRLANQAQEFKLQIATLKSEAHDHVDKLHNKYRQQIKKLNDALLSTRQLLTDEKQKNKHLKVVLDKQVEQSHNERKLYQKKLGERQGSDQSELVVLQNKFELELKTNVDRVTAELKERLDMREVELFYRDEQLGRLHQDIINLRKEKQSLVDGGGDRILKKLVDSGITFVAYHPGVDHLTIPVRDMAQYLESPLNYVAKKCSVDLELYQKWRAHHELPVCNRKLDDGSVCAVPVEKVEKPSHFIVGESDCCPRHSGNVVPLDVSINLRESG